MEPAAITPLATLLVAVINLIRAKRESESQHAQEALMAIREAAGKTVEYEKRRKKIGDKRDDEREMEISTTWYRASYPVFRYSRELSDRIKFKGNYWEAPEKWTELEVANAGIELQRVVDEADRLLKYKL